MWVGWLIAVILLTILEISTVNLVSVWFIASGLVSLFMSFYVDSLYIQVVVFVVLGIILMLLTRPILMKHMSKEKVKTNTDRVIGMEGIVTEAISKNKVGEVKVDGKRWSAISKREIPQDKTVIVESVDGVKLIVKECEE